MYDQTAAASGVQVNSARTLTRPSNGDAPAPPRLLESAIESVVSATAAVHREINYVRAVADRIVGGAKEAGGPISDGGQAGNEAQTLRSSLALLHASLVTLHSETDRLDAI